MGGRVAAFAEVDAGCEFCQRGGKIEVGGGVVDRVGRGGDDQRVDRAGVDVLLEIGEGAFAGGFRLQGEERLAFADVAEGEVDREGEVVDGCRLAGSGEDHRAALVGLEVGDERLDPGECFGVGYFVDAAGLWDAEFAGDLAGDVEDAAGGGAQAVVGHAAGERVGCLDHIKAVHRGRVGGLFIGFSFGFTAIEERCDRALRVGAGKVAIERQDAVGHGEIGGDLHAIAEGLGRLAGEGLVLIKLSRGEFR